MSCDEQRVNGNSNRWHIALLVIGSIRLLTVNHRESLEVHKSAAAENVEARQ